MDIEAFAARLNDVAEGRYQVLDRAAALALGGNTEDSVPDLTLLTEPPAYFSRMPAPPGSQRGAHGYLASHPDMAAFALGVGPSFRRVEIAEAKQLDIFPLILNMLGLPDPEPLPSDGGALLSALVKD